jgi:hypothetical protein
MRLIVNTADILIAAVMTVLVRFLEPPQFPSLKWFQVDESERTQANDRYRQTDCAPSD